ncbi:winged helix-turn-helix domain-containing protein [Streptomyces sp. SID13031]|uniref:winged helix-turn-helix domain-containing protein n=1 Tax=Streptomyces sp. SID13031 TaxID=2706046 RepID=UPI0013CDB2AA|nr:winged helix-turn-helix domain-containing protein [Streptomyces sp. SID13031]NEA35672.1 winged helix-turn-helix transcriptional regulator [Streptomyces sp. SID13031]
MLRIHFSPADLARVTFPAEPQPLWEAALAARALGGLAVGGLSVTPAGRRWRRAAAPLVRPSMRPLFKLISPTGRVPDFLTPEVPAAGLESSLAVLMDTPAEVVRDELGPYLPPEVDLFMRGLLAGAAESRRALGNAVRDFHQDVLVPSGVELERRYGADLALRSRALLQSGVEGLLASLHPDIEWDAPLLTTHGLSPGPAYDIHLAGRGLQLYPSSLTAETLVLDVPHRRPMLIYPTADLPFTDEIDGDALADLLGRTRAAVLRALTTSASTTQLARRTGISLASASEHAQVLRNAGLITTHRTAGAAHHSLTPSAHHLLTTGSTREVGRASIRGR